MTFRLELSFDRGAFNASSEAYLRDDVMPAIVEGLNTTLEAVYKRIAGAMLEVFDRPSPYTMQGLGVLRARVETNGRDPAGLVFIKDDQAAYLDLEVFGGQRSAGAPHTTRLGPLVPGPAAPLDAYGNLPRGYVEQVSQEPNVRWVHLRPGAPPALVRSLPGAPDGSGRQRGPRRRIEVLAFIVERTEYRPRLPFYQLVEDEVRKSGPEAFRKALAKIGK